MKHTANGQQNSKAGVKSSSRQSYVVEDPRHVRNVVLVGHSGAGKTMLTEALLAASGAIRRAGSIADGNTVTDSDPAAIKQQRSVSLSVAALRYGEYKVNLLDTPGYGDFIGELRAGLRAADAALFVVSAVDGVDAATVALWEECAGVDLPRAIAVTHLDNPHADFADIVAICQRVFGEGVLALHLPVHDDQSEDHPVIGVMNLLTTQIANYRNGFPPSIQDSEADHQELVEQRRGDLIESIIAESEDETLLDRYIGGELDTSDTNVDMLLTDMERAVARATFYPALPTVPTAGVGLAEVLHLLTSGFPSAVERPIPPVAYLDGRPHNSLSPDPSGPLVAEVVKTTLDPYIGRVSTVRVFSGTLRPDQPIHVCGHGLAERGHPDHDEADRASHIYSPLGSTLQEITYCIAGDICALPKISAAETGDTISAKDYPLLIAPWPMPQPQLPIAVAPKTRTDEDAMAKNLAKLISGDPTLRLERNAETNQLVLWCMGEAHADVVLDRLRLGGVELTTEPVRIALRETFAGPARGHGRHVKQSGGHGQFGVCDLEITPLPRGSGIEFVDHIVGGAINHQFIGSVEKGVRTQLGHGVLDGHPVVDVRVTLVDGKMHSVDSSDAAFQAAGAAAVRDAASNGSVILLEPIDEVKVQVPDVYLGQVMSDISTRRGRIVGTEPAESEETTIISAELPAAELVRYPIQLRSLSSGTATFTRQFLRYEPARD